MVQQLGGSVMIKRVLILAMIAGAVYGVPFRFAPMANFGAVELWTPADLDGLALWLDGMDGDTVTLDGNGNVSQWDDKSGNDSHAVQGGSGRRPAYTNNVLRFDDDWMISPHQIAITNAATVIVAKSRKLERQRMTGMRATQTGRWYVNSDSFFKGDASVDIADNLNTRMFYLGADATHMHTFVDGADTGTQSDTNSATQLNTIIGGAATVVGATTPRTDILAKMDLSEFIATDAHLSTSDRQKLEGYMAHKWGLTDNLPANHPYKNAPPTK
jgi:hypothetical protein